MIYLDNAATTKMYDEVIDIEKDFEKNYFANPSALHSFGMEVEEKIKESRKYIADYIGSNENEIFFTKGATESNNIVINSFKSSKNTAITSKLEHASVIDTFNNSNFKEVRLVNNDNFGFIDIDMLENLIDDTTKLISLIYVQNEIGTIQNIKKINEVIRNKNKNIFFHLDATQALGKIDCNVKKLGADALSFSSHKIHGPKGIGALYINKKKLGKIKTYLYGGRQELVSSGTLNSPAIYAFSKALYLSRKKEDIDHVKKLNLYLRNKLIDSIDHIHINSSLENSSPYILNISFENTKSEILLHMLEKDQIYVSSGSACSKGKDNRILDAIGLDEKYKNGAIRFSFSSEISFEDLDKVVDSLKKHVEEIRTVF